jgi:hypothetical protein
LLGGRELQPTTAPAIRVSGFHHEPPQCSPTSVGQAQHHDLMVFVYCVKVLVRVFESADWVSVCWQVQEEIIRSRV